MAQPGFKRKLTAILSADVAGYSRLMGEDEEDTVRTLTTHREVFYTLVQQHNGKVLDSPGDNILAEFASVVAAVQCGMSVQKELLSRNAKLPENRRMEFRIGINLGDVIEEGGRIYGDGVNIAARLEGLAEPGGICISKTAFDHVESKLPLGYEFLGDQTAKNIAKPVGAYRIQMEPRVTVDGAKVTPLEPVSVGKLAFPLPEKPSIAVLPFDNLSKEQEYLVDGLTESIICTLSKIPELFVIARNSTYTYKGRPVKVQRVAQDLGVQYVLEGSLQKSGERLRVTAKLIDALSAHHIWSEKYDREMKDLFAIQDDIALKIAIAMQVELTDGAQARIRHSTNNLEAWSLAVKAHDLFETYRKDDNKRARELFNKAVELDPNYAYAWVYLGWTYWIDGRWYSIYYNSEDCYQRAEEMAQIALSIDYMSSDALALLSGVYLSQCKYDAAVATGKKCIALDPNSSENHAIVAITMQDVGDGKEVISLIKKAMRLNPYFPAWYWWRLGAGYRLIGQYEEAAKAIEKRVEIAEKIQKPQSMMYIELAITYSMMNKLEDARAFVEKALDIDPKTCVSSYGKALSYKDPEYTERILEALRKAGLPGHPPSK